MTTLNAFSGEAFTPAEAAYFQSGGTVTEGLTPDTGGGQLDFGLGKETPPQQGASEDVAPAQEDKDEEVTIGPDGRARDTSGKFVPHAAMHKERERRKAVEAENLTMREKLARAEERMSVLNELMARAEAQPSPQPAQPQAAPQKSALDEDPIDPNTDPFGFMEQLKRQNAELLRMHKQTATQQKEQERASSISTAYMDDARAFMAKAPDFKDAYLHLISGLHSEYEAMGISDEAQRNAMIAKQERELVAQLIESKRSPAEAIYAIAKARGYASKATPAPAPAAPQPKASNAGSAPSNAPSRLDTILKGQSAVVSLASAGGSSGEGLTMEHLASMSEAEFAEIARRVGKAGMRKIMGGG